MYRDERLLRLEVLISTRLATLSGSDVLADNPRDVASDTAGTFVGLANDFLMTNLGFNTYNSSRAGKLRAPPIRHGRFAVLSA